MPAAQDEKHVKHQNASSDGSRSKCLRVYSQVRGETDVGEPFGGSLTHPRSVCWGPGTPLNTSFRSPGRGPTHLAGRRRCVCLCCRSTCRELTETFPSASVLHLRWTTLTYPTLSLPLPPRLRAMCKNQPNSGF